jgi:hypothetical protein
MEEATSTKNINEKWLENIFNSLMRMKEAEKRLWEGCTDLLEFVNTDQMQLPIIQSKNYDLFILETEILLADVKSQIDENVAKEIKIKIKNLRELEKIKKGFLGIKRNYIDKTKEYFIKPSFVVAKEEISEIREKLVSALWKILSPNAKESMGEMPR